MQYLSSPVNLQLIVIFVYGIQPLPEGYQPRGLFQCQATHLHITYTLLVSTLPCDIFRVVFLTQVDDLIRVQHRLPPSILPGPQSILS